MLGERATRRAGGVADRGATRSIRSGLGGSGGFGFLQVAGDPMPGPDLAYRRFLCRAAVERERAARVEAAAAGRIDRARHVAVQNDRAAARRRVRHRHRRQQRARIGMAATAVNRSAPVRQLDDLAEIHHRDAVRQVLDDRQIVADEQQRQPEFVLQIEPAG